MSADIIGTEPHCSVQGGRAMIERPRRLLGADHVEDLGILVPGPRALQPGRSAVPRDHHIMTTAAIYVRKSNDQGDRSEDVKSVAVQKDLVIRFIDKQGWTLGPVFEDDGTASLAPPSRAGPACSRFWPL